ncbi:YceD family protein [Parvibaculum sp.]|jgi:uncharacterized metal-binding protein YceD (DUF177 family)|uniref:YceD family protein n=1 Tax=Parvibaculum sp. TaxID=2024848 RepID=UPI00391BB9BD
MSGTEAPEFSLRVLASEVPPAGKELRFIADDETRRRLAERLGIVELKRLTGVASLRPYRKEGLTLDCRFEADLVQSCVVTLEPVDEHVEEEFRQRYLPAHLLDLPSAKAPENQREIAVDIEADDAPEAMVAGGVDVGEAVAERLALAIDPYPRKPGASFDTPAEALDDASETRPNPFAALEKLKKNY